MRLILLVLMLISVIGADAQQWTIFGPQSVARGATAYYEAYSSSTIDPTNSVTWEIPRAAYILEQGRVSGNAFYVALIWEEDNFVGEVKVREEMYYTSASYPVQVGAPQIMYGDQWLDYGAPASNMCVELAGFFPSMTFQWQVSDDQYNWSNIANGTSCHLPTVYNSPKYYRCITGINGTLHYSDPVIVGVKPFGPGSITLLQQPAYNTVPAIANTAAEGGLCSPANYQYAWEASVEGGPWVAIGTGPAFPSNAPSFIGNTLIRRRVSCAGQTTYSNILDIRLSYTSLDFENRSYVRTYTVATKGIQSLAQADQLEVGKKFQETSYYDGLGRTTQIVNKGVSITASDTWVDMVSIKKYDNLGRSPLSYLPFPSATNPGKFKTSTSELTSFYAAKFSETAPWTKVITESSPLNTIQKSIDAGSHRINNNIGVDFDYSFNNANNIDEQVHIWRIGYSAGAFPVTSIQSVYANGVLTCLITKDENGKKIIDYKDVRGNLVLRKVQLNDPGAGLTNAHAGWLCTYYVYDGFGRQRFVITPKAVAFLEANNWELTEDIANELCYSYEYDAKGRLIREKKPGVGALSMLYDQRGQLVFSQDANQAEKSPKEWRYNEYDELGRMTMLGIYKSNKTSFQLQAEINSASTVTNIVVVGPGDEDLSFSSRPSQYAPLKYMATKSVTLIEGFSSNGPNDEFSVEIGPVAIAKTVSVTGNSVPSIEVSNPSIFTALLYNYYDSYDFTGSKSFDNSFANYQAYPAGTSDIDPIQLSKLVRGKVTGSKVRILGTGSFLQTTVYYDDLGRELQTLGDNSRNGVDVITNQYHFSGRVMSISSRHGLPGGAFNGFVTVTKNEYDRNGRLKSLSKKFGSAAFVKTTSFTYDEFGQVKSKRLGKKPLTTDDPLEIIDYSYTLSGRLIGLNKDYALSGNNLDQRNRYFGVYLGYENTDSRFSKGRHDGLITGMIWKSQGDNSQRMYDYSYDNASRMVSAEFKQKLKPSDGSWVNNVDFSESSILYDENGNLKRLYRKGIVPAHNNSIYIDKLSYTYKNIGGGEYSNQLVKVFDNNPGLGQNENGKLGDFKDEIYNVDAADYSYDKNGNLIVDNNKKVRYAGGQGVIYNYANKPEKIIIENGSVVEYSYDALGIKLTKTVTPAGGSPNITYYINEYVYEGNELKFLNLEDGRLRVMVPEATVSPLGASSLVTNGSIQLSGDKWGIFEYFIKDHLGSTRMVLSEEYHKEVYKATIELAAAAEEERFFGKVNENGDPAASNELQQTRWPNDGVWPSNASAKIAKLQTISNGTQRSVGPNMLLKVMSGDYLNARADYYYELPSGPVNSFDILAPVVNSLLGIVGSGGINSLLKRSTGALQSSLGNSVSSPLINIFNGRPAAASNRPKAYLSVIFFDENLNPVQNGSQADIVKATNNDDFVSLSNIQVPQNGYAYLYLSNESEIPVYFDNLQVAHERSPIMEESHYYPFGLKIASISARAFSKPLTKSGYQGEYSEWEEEIGWNDFQLRSYDPQIGRWVQGDPMDEFASPYVGMGNNPANTVDPTGGLTGGEWGAIIGTIVGFAAPYAYEAISGEHVDNKAAWGAAGAFIAAGIGYGVGASVAGEGPVMMNIRAFYRGLFGGGGQPVHTLMENTVWNQHWNNVYAPEIWGRIGKAVHSIFTGVPPEELIVDRLIKATKIGGLIKLQGRKKIEPSGKFIEIPINKQEDQGTRRRRVRRPVNVTFANSGNPGFAQWSGSLSVGEIDFAERAIRRANNFLTNNPNARIGSISVTLNSVYAFSALTGVIPDGYEVKNSRGIRIDGASTLAPSKYRSNGQPGHANITQQAANIAEYIGRRLNIPSNRVSFQANFSQPDNTLQVTMSGTR